MHFLPILPTPSQFCSAVAVFCSKFHNFSRHTVPWSPVLLNIPQPKNVQLFSDRRLTKAPCSFDTFEWLPSRQKSSRGQADDHQVCVYRCILPPSTCIPIYLFIFPHSAFQNSPSRVFAIRHDLSSGRRLPPPRSSESISNPKTEVFFTVIRVPTTKCGNIFWWLDRYLLYYFKGKTTLLAAITKWYIALLVPQHFYIFFERDLYDLGQRTDNFSGHIQVKKRRLLAQ